MHDAPEGLGDAGAALWRLVIDDVPDGMELEARELHTLESACRVRDDIVALEATVEAEGRTITGARGTPLVHPALQECRQLRTVELRLLREINTTPETVHSSRASHAAKARWARERRSA